MVGLLQAHLRLVAVLRGADDLHHVVEVGDRDEEAVEDVPAGEGLVELELRAAGDHLEAVVHVAAEEVLQVHDARAALVDREHVRAERRLQLGVPVEFVEDDLAHGVALELHDDADILGGLVADVRDALDDLLLHEVGHVLDHLGLVDHVGNLGDHDPLAVALPLLDLGAAAHADLPPSELVHRADAVHAADHRAGGEVGALHELHEVIDRAVAVVDVVRDAVAELAEVVRRDVRRHAHGDALRAVQQQVRELRRQDGRLGERLVEVRHHVHGVLFEVREHFLGGLLHAHLGVAHGGGAVAVDGAEVAVAVHERHAQRERLRHAHDRLVDGRVAVRVVLAHHLADDAGGLHVLRARGNVELVHAEERPAVDRLEAIARVGERAPDDHRHRVVDVVAAHLLDDVHILQNPPRRGFRHGGFNGFFGLLFFAHGVLSEITDSVFVLRFF